MPQLKNYYRRCEAIQPSRCEAEIVDFMRREEEKKDKKTKMSDLIEEFQRIRGEFKKTINEVPEEKREELLFGDWSLKDVVAHLSNWMVHDLECLEKLKKGEIPFWEPDVDEFNHRGVVARRKISWHEVYREFIDLGEKLLKAYQDLPEDAGGKEFWQDKGLTPRRLLEEDIFHWKSEHLPQIVNTLKNKFR